MRRAHLSRQALLGAAAAPPAEAGALGLPLSTVVPDRPLNGRPDAGAAVDAPGLLAAGVVDQLLDAQLRLRELMAACDPALRQAAGQGMPPPEEVEALCIGLSVHLALKAECIHPALRARSDTDWPLLDLCEAEAELLQGLAESLHRAPPEDARPGRRAARLALMLSLADLHLYREVTGLYPLVARWLPEAGSIGQSMRERRDELVSEALEHGTLRFENEADDPVGLPPH